MYNRVLISFIIILSATFLFTENQDKLDFSGLKKIISNNAINTKKLESMKLREKNRLTKKISKMRKILIMNKQEINIKK